MTYCVGMRLDAGLVFMSDTRTNAGVDNFSASRKLFTFCNPGERAITILTAGNLATTQAMISLLQERSQAVSERNPSILSLPTMFQVARLVGSTLREVIAESAQDGATSSDTFSASAIVGGQIKGGRPTIFMVYPAGNFIEVTRDSPFFQIGETKYGKPILVRGYDSRMSFEEALRLLLVSFDSTVKANLSVGLPFDVQVLPNETFNTDRRKRIEADDPTYHAISTIWGDALKDALLKLPLYEI